jgi:hypothetical protein
VARDLLCVHYVRVKRRAAMPALAAIAVKTFDIFVVALIFTALT